MDISLTTRWNASRHNDGRSMIEEVLEMGFDAVELGYDTRMDLIEGVEAMVNQGAVKVYSLHNFCPVPMGVSRGHPETYTFGSLDERERANAVRCTKTTIETAARLGAKVIVSHSGNVSMTRKSGVLKDMLRHNQQFSGKYERIKMKFMTARDKKGKRHLPNLYKSMQELLPTLEEHGVAIALENLPTWEAIPTETEIEQLCNYFKSPYIKYWHDMGHGQIRENMGMINHLRWLERLEPHLGGMHVHDVTRPVRDHTMPPLGHIEFALYKKIGGRRDIPRVIEPRPPTPREEIIDALHYLRAVWAEDTTPASAKEPPANSTQGFPTEAAQPKQHVNLDVAAQVRPEPQARAPQPSLNPSTNSSPLVPPSASRPSPTRSDSIHPSQAPQQGATDGVSTPVRPQDEQYS